MAQNVKYWRAVLRGHDRSLTKRAELGGDGRDMSFEQAFSNLAHAYLRDKAPGLLDYEVGFQLIDRNQDNTRAVGILGFKVGTQWVYAPVFWLNGDLKGHELLYLKNQDLFVPLKESWLNYITNRKPNLMGQSVDRNTSMIGVMRPDLDRLSNSPNKFASDQANLPEMVDAVLPTFRKIVSTAPAKWEKYAELTNFADFLCDQDLDTLQWLVKASQSHPVIARAIQYFYGPETMSKAIKEAGKREKAAGSILDDRQPPSLATEHLSGSVLSPNEQHPVKRGSLRVLTHQQTHEDEPPAGLDEDDAEKLLRDGLLIKDRRTGEELAIPYNLQTESTLRNPHESGLYMVLTGVGEFTKCFIAMKPVGPAGRKNFCTVVRLEGDRDWINAHPSHIWVAGDHIPGETSEVGAGLDLNKWIEGLNESLPSGKQRFILVGYNGNATVPLRKEKELGNEQGAQIWEVDCDDFADHPYAESVLEPEARNTMSFHDAGNYDRYRDGCRIHFNGKAGRSIRTDLGDMFIPEGFKVLTIEPAADDDSDDPGARSGQSEDAPLRLANLVDRELGIIPKHTADAYHQTTAKGDDTQGSVLDGSPKDDNPKHTDADRRDSEKQSFTLGDPKRARRELMQKLSSLTIWNDGLECEVNRNRMPLKAGLVHLVRDHGFREKVARELLKRAERKRKLTFHVQYPAWWHKQALQGPSPFLSDSQPQSVPFPPPEVGGDPLTGGRVPALYRQEESQIIPSLSGQTDRDIYNPDTDRDKTPMDLAQSATAATQMGQREIFDTSMLGSMLKAVRDDSMVDRYLGDLTKGMDRLGRILLMFYWHGDEFAERYGKEDMPELEDNLRNAFEQAGDVLLFLRQKTIDPYPEEQTFDLNTTHE